MRSPLTMNRRHFIAAVAVFTVVTCAGKPANATVIDPYDFETWGALVGSVVTVGTVSATLAECRRSVTGGFGLTFESDGRPFEEGIHVVKHPDVGHVELFMTAHRNRALATINRTQGVN